jgi:hypothetical protein
MIKYDPIILRNVIEMLFVPSRAILARAQPQELNPVTPSRRISTLAEQIGVGIVIDSSLSRLDSTLNTTIHSRLTESGGKINRFTLRTLFFRQDPISTT